MIRITDRTILIVDDRKENRALLRNALARDYDVVEADDGERALEAIWNHCPDLILLDIRMPRMDGFEVCTQLQTFPEFREIPVIFLTAASDVTDKTRGFELGAVDYITKPFSVIEVQARVKTHLSLAIARKDLENQREVLAEMVGERTRELELTQDVTIIGMATLAEYRDNETGGHIHRTRNYTRLLAERLQMDPAFRAEIDTEFVVQVYKSAPLHDIGKVGVPDSILLKPDRLTTAEFDAMKKHTIYGRDAILKAEQSLGAGQTSSFLRIAREIAISHHEKWDGTGYPYGLKEEEIPLTGRIMAFADVYDALISRRVYKPPFPHNKAVSIIAEGGDTQFDPRILSVFLEIHESFRNIAKKFADSKEERESLDL